MKLPFDPLRILSAKLFGNIQKPTFEYDQVVQGTTWACIDLGAFPRPLPRLKGIDGVVIMEDRNPEFFLSFQHYQPWRASRLNRHGPLKFWRTQHDLKELVNELHDQKIKVLIGFWNFGGTSLRQWRRASFFRQHPEFRKVPGSRDMYPFVTLMPEGISYAEYIAHQYRKLQETFGFDGLMLGDGFSGMRSFEDPDLYRDQKHMIPQWTEMYREITQAVHQTNGILFAYDCMGLSASEARRHGVDYRELSMAGLDFLVYESYPQAWSEYWLASYRDRFDLESSRINLKSVKKELQDTNTNLLYTVELGDSLEDWWVDSEKTKKQIEMLDPIADGRFLVWANDLFATTNQPE